MSEFWNNRYNEEGFAYGIEPNEFFASSLETLTPGTALFPCEGEGRNAVYAAKFGWDVFAFDMSSAGRLKAEKLAGENGVQLSYKVCDALEANYPDNSFDLVVIIYAHLPEPIRKQFHTKLISWLKPNGRIILECFNPEQLKNNSGGPKEIGMLYTPELLKEDFKGLHFELCENHETMLDEGPYHKGKADVVRMIAVKS